MTLDKKLRINFIGIDDLEMGYEPRKYNPQSLVQGYIDGQPFLYASLFCHADTVHHLVYRFLSAGEPLFSNEKLSEYSNSRWSPEKLPLKSDRYRVTGMGLLNVDTIERTLKFHGHSGTFEIEIDENHVRDISRELTDWQVQALVFDKSTQSIVWQVQK